MNATILPYWNPFSCDMIGFMEQQETLRLLQPGKAPTTEELANWLGREGYPYWLTLTQLIDQDYPGIFVPDWIYGGKKHGWALRYKKSRPLCTLIPEKNRTSLLIVLGGEERAKVETLRDQLSSTTCLVYDAATTYHDGKWLVLILDNDTTLQDARLLLHVKRKSRIA